jgi:uncharacterized protein with ATP-grasp and redox domains
MEPLKLIPQCIDCLLSLAKSATLMAAPDNTSLAEKTEAAARKILADAEINASSSPQVANRILREIRRLSGVEDPFAEFKAREMDQARKIFSQLKAHVGKSLRSRVSLAILANSLDFFKNPEQALAEIPQQFLNKIAFYRDDLDQFEAFLQKEPGLVLYLTDNAGEIYFDLPLFEYIRSRCKQTMLVVKGGPSLNDLTRAELRSADLEHIFGNVADTGTDGAGIDWENVSRDFLDLIASADLILSKGMANFETLYPRDVSAPIFFLFKVKCEPIQNYIQAPPNSFMALWKKEI